MQLFFECPFSQGFSWDIGIECNSDNNTYDMIQDANIRYAYDDFKSFIFVA